MYGDYDGPNKSNKGLDGGACNVTRCQMEPADYYNHGSMSWYCKGCSIQIGQNPVNKRGWDLNHKPQCGHDMFETREEMDERIANAPPPPPPRKDGTVCYGDQIRNATPKFQSREGLKTLIKARKGRM